MRITSQKLVLAHLATDALGCSADRYELVDGFAENAEAGHVDVLAESGPQALPSVAKCASAYFVAAAG